MMTQERLEYLFKTDSALYHQCPECMSTNNALRREMELDIVYMGEQGGIPKYDVAIMCASFLNCPGPFFVESYTPGGINNDNWATLYDLLLKNAKWCKIDETPRVIELEPLYTPPYDLDLD